MKKYSIVLFGIVFLAVGVFIYFKNASLISNCTVETEATVIDMKEELSTDESGISYIYYPIIEYTAGKKIIRGTMDKGSNPPEYALNSKITILYNPDKVSQFIVKGDNSSSIIGIAFMALGIFITSLGIRKSLKKYL